MNGTPEDRDVLRSARLIASFVVLALLVFVVVFDRLGPIISIEYHDLSDTVVGLLLGALFALVGVQGIDFFRGK